ncbi:MAG: hypothetical protein B1H04_00975 [Planctomycetales bacterium 4484_123]|nr:MAG: hypothetical protein B1H04_00975 [Planctomycetales bacterium 4484_123]
MDQTVTNPKAQSCLKVLLVEDDPDCRELVRYGLSVSGIRCELYEAETATDALDFLHRRGRRAGAPRPDLIFLDLKLPGMSGQEVLKIVKASPELASVPVVILTGCEGQKYRAEAVRNGANGFIVKPLNPEAFARAVGEATRIWGALAV